MAFIDILLSTILLGSFFLMVLAGLVWVIMVEIRQHYRERTYGRNPLWPPFFYTNPINLTTHISHLEDQPQGSSDGSINNLAMPFTASDVQSSYESYDRGPRQQLEDTQGAERDEDMRVECREGHWVWEERSNRKGRSVDLPQVVIAREHRRGSSWSAGEVA
ncbi:hypothetical protein NM688_g3456 [Phlebia brevispora]|uniref:Uncharacterized protein n=1 Tax=Phlebia brevispora TaxID=194682 RepID=A0ACC1T5Q1_9APHY|nr:hypothetical protein NM688_g3456 [Phlebia brevispora]